MLQKTRTSPWLTSKSDKSHWHCAIYCDLTNGTQTESVVNAGIILVMRSANGRQRHIGTSSLIGWANTQNELCSEMLQWQLTVTRVSNRWQLLTHITGPLRGKPQVTGGLPSQSQQCRTSVHVMTSVSINYFIHHPQWVYHVLSCLIMRSSIYASSG